MSEPLIEDARLRRAVVAQLAERPPIEGRTIDVFEVDEISLAPCGCAVVTMDRRASDPDQQRLEIKVPCPERA